MLFAIYYGDDAGYSDTVGPFGSTEAASVEEATKKLDVELIPGTMRVVPSESIRQEFESCGALWQTIAENLVLVAVKT